MTSYTKITSSTRLAENSSYTKFVANSSFTKFTEDSSYAHFTDNTSYKQLTDELQRTTSPISSTAYSTEPLAFAGDADIIYGLILIAIFLLGTTGNTMSFIYFRSKKKDIANTTYMLITANDIIVSITALPAALCFLAGRDPGLIFGDKTGIVIWFFLWEGSVRLSIFLVICLCITRTVAMLRPFYFQKIRYLVAAVMVYSLLQLIQLIVIVLIGDSIVIRFDHQYAKPVARLTDLDVITNTALFYAVNTHINDITPVLVVGTCCIISIVKLRQQRGVNQQYERQKSRSRATSTILMFSLVYGICNIPFSLENTLRTHALLTGSWDVYYHLYKYDTLLYLYYNNITHTHLRAANSAANPVLYYWRMPRLRDHTVTWLRDHTVSVVCRLWRRLSGGEEATGNGFVHRPHTGRTTPGVLEANL